MAARTTFSSSGLFFFSVVILLLYASPTAAFGAGNIASVAKIEGHNWRHGDIEDMLKTIAFLKGHKWTSMMIKRVYFGNWLRDYSQALDVGTLKGLQSGTIRILVWVLSFLSFGYATEEFEVTEERLGVYRPEEHIDNPKDYADNVDARRFDQRLRPPVQPNELQIDPQTGMKNYIANETLGIATSAGYVKFSLARSIHFGRLYTSGMSGTNGKDTDLCEALRCLGQALHCLEDFGAHTNYTELALREQGFHGVFPHTGTATEINIMGCHVFPVVTGTFGVVDFLHSVLGEATDHFAQTEVEQMDIALGNAQDQSKPSSGKRNGGTSQISKLTTLLSQVPGAGALCQQAERLQAHSDAQTRSVETSRGLQEEHRGPAKDASAYGTLGADTQFSAPPGSLGGPPGPGIPGMSASFDPMKTAAQIYPILEFRDKVVRVISATIEKVPGLEALVEKITENLTIFVLSLLAPFIRPIINAVSKQLKNGSTGVVDASGKHQYEPWTDPNCTDPTHSLLSKDHFSNILNEPAGQVAAVILQYAVPRIVYAWEHPDIPTDQVLNDISRVFHHPALRDHDCELHRNMYDVVQRWANSRQNMDLNHILGSESVRIGKNHIEGHQDESHGGLPSLSMFMGSASHSKVSGAPWEKLHKLKNVTGLRRDNVEGEEGSSRDIPGTFPEAESAFVNTQPSEGSHTGYAGGSNPTPQPYHGDQAYPRPPDSTTTTYHSRYDNEPAGPSWNQTYQPSPNEPYPQEGWYPPPQRRGDYPIQAGFPLPQGGYPPSHVQSDYEYGAQPPYGYDSGPPQSPSQYKEHQQGYYGGNAPQPPPGQGYYR